MVSICNRLLDMLKESVIVQSLVTLALVVTLCIMWTKQLEVPKELTLLTFSVVGFWFGSKIAYRQILPPHPGAGQNE